MDTPCSIAFRPIKKCIGILRVLDLLEVFYVGVFFVPSYFLVGGLFQLVMVISGPDFDG